MVIFGARMNALEAFVGGLLGLVFKSRVSDDLGDFLLKGQGLCVVLVAVQGMTGEGNISVVTLSVALGALVGYLLDIDGAVRRLGDWVQGRLDALLAGSDRFGSFSEGFVTSTLFTCTGAMAIVGSLESGIALQHETLIAKGVIDPSPLITGKIALGDIVEKGFLELINNKDNNIKIIVDPNK